MVLNAEKASTNFSYDSELITRMIESYSFVRWLDKRGRPLSEAYSITVPLARRNTKSDTTLAKAREAKMPNSNHEGNVRTHLMIRDFFACSVEASPKNLCVTTRLSDINL
mmetsp:Transcript_15718/g.18164  ORF Transcript_15718/g.18164 Transcript_15718/m.18164 type:complete len:110 (-) Transcript_15718:501-830(-)